MSANFVQAMRFDLCRLRLVLSSTCYLSPVTYHGLSVPLRGMRFNGMFLTGHGHLPLRHYEIPAH
jgi:hypothetical protein